MIVERYVLFTRIPLYRSADNRIWTDRLWQKDLVEHQRYIANFRLCCPLLPHSPDIPDLVEVRELGLQNIFPLRLDRGWGSVAFNVIPNFLIVLRACRWAEITHAGAAGWAFPLSYYILLLRPFLPFKAVEVIESTFWMKPRSGKVSVRRHLSHWINTFLVKRCVHAADARIFTQDWYRQFFLGSHDAAHVSPAVWIDGDIMRPEADLLPAQQQRSGPLRLLFPARLIADKGVETVLEAISMAERMRAGVPGASPFIVDIIGSGPLEDTCKAFAAERPDGSVRFLPPVPYGEAFFALLRSYDAVIVANRKEEQPRIVFDAFSQGVPCIATRTSGIREVVREGENCVMFDVDDVAGLARILDGGEGGPERFRELGLNALRSVSGSTHRAMHERREVFLRETLHLK